MAFCVQAWSPPASAEPLPQVAPESPPKLEGLRALRWNPAWPRFRTAEYAVTGAMLAGTIALAASARYRKPLWHGGILFDDSVRSGLRADSADGRERAHQFGSKLYLGSFGFSVADALISAWAIRGSSDVAGQMLLIDVEAYALVGLLQFSASTFVRRERPYESDCRKGMNPGFPGCSPKNADGSLSFFAGHTAIAFTNAGLTCAHHQYLHLYGDVGDALMCGLTTASAVTVAYTRIASDKHYATDDLTGILLGASIGYLTPTLLHYRAAPVREAAGVPKAHISAVLPAFSPTSFGLAMAGDF